MSARFVEIAPPTVSTEFHRERSDPDDNKKEKNSAALSVEEFMDFFTKNWKADKEVIGVRMSQKVVDRRYNEFGHDYEKAAGTKSGLRCLFWIGLDGSIVRKGTRGTLYYVTFGSL